MSLNISSLLTTLKQFYDTQESSGDKALATELYGATIKAVDQAVAKGLLHKNNAAHKKSRFTLMLNKMA